MADVREMAHLLALLVLRGFLLWVVLPLTALAWVLRLPYGQIRRRTVKLGAALGWADLNLVAGLERVLRPISPGPVPPCVPWRDAATVTHRVLLQDPV